MDLNFLGRGADFNPKEGNTSAFFIENNELFLIDCGESVFGNIIMEDVLDGINKINLMITHTHPDHIGSAASLIGYAYYNPKQKRIPVDIILPGSTKYLYSRDIKILLRKSGSERYKYNFACDKDFDGKYNSFQSLRYVKTTHYSKLKCYSLIFNTKNGIIYYSGDTNEINTLMKIINSGEKIDKIFLDTTTDDYEGNVHLNIEIIKDNIPEELYKKVYCMHFNNDECIKRANEIGFNVVEKYKKGKTLTKKI